MINNARKRIKPGPSQGRLGVIDGDGRGESSSGRGGNHRMALLSWPRREADGWDQAMSDHIGGVQEAVWFFWKTYQWRGQETAS